MKTQKTKKPEIISDFFNFLEDFSAYIFILESIKHQYIYSSTRSKIREKILIMLRLKSYAGEEKLISSGRVTIRTLVHLIADFLSINKKDITPLCNKISECKELSDLSLISFSEDEYTLMFDIMKPFMNQMFVYRLIKYHDKKRNLHLTTELEQEKQDLLDFANTWDIKFDIDHIPKALHYNNGEIGYIDSKKSKKSPMVFSDFF
ncbi:MAG: hypothetical protein HG424_001760 [candidate division SR1 bacterium]|nr:hypothetical protein [candidate division SR1 bacterium]